MRKGDALTEIPHEKLIYQQRRQSMNTNKKHIDNNNIQSIKLKITDKQTEMLARRLLPEINKFYADLDVRKEFEEWKKLL